MRRREEGREEGDGEDRDVLFVFELLRLMFLSASRHPGLFSALFLSF